MEYLSSLHPEVKMEFQTQPEEKTSVTSETAPLIEPVDCADDADLFMVPLKRRSAVPLAGQAQSPYTQSPFANLNMKRSPQLTSAETEESSSRQRSSRLHDSPPQQHGSPVISPPSSVYGDAPDITVEQAPPAEGAVEGEATAPPIPALSAARLAKKNKQQLQLQQAGGQGQEQQRKFLAPPIEDDWAIPDSPRERLSQVRATPDSAYDRARNMEIHRSEWKHVVYRFPVKGKGHWVVDCDLTESSHARLSDVARRSSDGFEWNGDYELANIYRVLSLVHKKLMEEMRVERQKAGG
ncbi:hypothetical protein B0H63DRAFT_139446 [Podospora didyma]|uniref:Uncharacterized protein n=1 Tax=Podospora didyma TaxID=330526 RepID=A0AAE0NS71_9PEZI|nr:hypothetical protein B0H63DRAFT_139446 [Podospora didyma]